MTDGEHITLDYVASKLQMFDTEFHERHYKSVDLFDDSVELATQQRILDDHECCNIDFLTRIMNIRCCEKTITLLLKLAEQTNSLNIYHRSLWLLHANSQARIINDTVEKGKLKTINSGRLEHLMEQVTNLLDELKVVLKEMIPLKNVVVPLDETINLDKFLRQLKGL